MAGRVHRGLYFAILLMPLICLLALSWSVYSRWDSIPDPLLPIRTAHAMPKSVPLVGSMFLFFMFLGFTTALTSYGLYFASAIEAKQETPDRASRTLAALMLFVEYGSLGAATLILSAILLQARYLRETFLALKIWSILFILMVALGTLRYWMLARLDRPETEAPGLAKRKELGGKLYYFNRQDPRLWVPAGFRYTVNFARWEAWPYLLLLLLTLASGAIWIAYS